MQIPPDDTHNRTLIDHVHPADWISPRPKDRYQLVVIGGGPAGLVAAFGAAGLGARVALVERHLLGGDCLNMGCVPSKALLRSAHAAYEVRRAAEHGVVIDSEIRVDFAAVMRRMRKIRADISHHDAATRLRDAGIDVFFGEGRFLGRDRIQVGSAELRFSRCVVATGARAASPAIPGIDHVHPLDNEGLFELTELPRRLAVLGAGPIGAEMAQAFRRFGSEVHLIDMAPRVLPREDPDASKVLQEQLAQEGIMLHLGAHVRRLERADGAKVVLVDRGQGELRIVADEILMALGRRPNVAALSLDAGGVTYGPRGIEVDDYMRTTNPSVYAVGDVASAYQFTHAADAMARLVLRNALVFNHAKASSLTIPWATYTYPEVAHVGPAPAVLANRTDLKTVQVNFSDLDRAICDGETAGFAKVHFDRRGHIVAGTIVGRHAGDLIQELALAIRHKITLSQISSSVYAYPTRSEVIKKLGDAYNRTRFTPSMAARFKTWLRWKLG